MQIIKGGLLNKWAIILAKCNIIIVQKSLEIDYIVKMSLECSEITKINIRLTSKLK